MANAASKRFCRSVSSFAAVCIGLAVAMVSSPGMAAPPGDAELNEKVMRFVERHVSDAGVPLHKASDISIDYADLNGDGMPEALVIIEAGSYCGARGCAAFVLDLGGSEARSIGDFIAVQVKPLPTSTGGWRDIAINGHPISFRDGAYRSR